jgi:dihydrofolate reductase
MIRLYVAASLDGYIAEADGGVGWLDAFMTPDAASSYERFLDDIGTIVMGRSTYEQVLTFGEWAYGDRRTVVLTSAELTNGPTGTETVSLDALPDLLAQLAEEERDVWLMGGGQTVRAFLDLDAIDEIELYLIPTLLGSGLRLFPRGTAVSRLQLAEVQQLSEGMVMLRYRRPTA